MESGILSIVATPIGNMEDITLRALRVLGEVDYVLCEDTRVTGKLLARHNLKATLKRYDAHASQSVQEAIVSDLQAGKHIALVSDAGTPGVSDPGVLLVNAARALGARLEVIPGASAVTAAVSLAGFTGNQFTFLGFVPQKKGRETFFKNLSAYSHPVIFFESTHRIMKTLGSLTSYYGENSTVNRTIAIARELTKLHEEFVSGTPEEVLAYFEEHVDHQKGEFVIIVSPANDKV